MPTPLEQLKDLANLGMAQVATKQELEVFLKAVIQILKETQTKNADTTTALLTRFNTIKADLDKKDKECTAMLKLAEQKTALVPDMPKMMSEMKGMVAQNMTDMEAQMGTIHEGMMQEIETDLPKLGVGIRNGLELLIGDERLDRKAVKGIDELEKTLSDKIDAVPRGGGGGGGIVRGATRYQKLTPDGSTKIFSVPKSVTAIIFMSDFPHVLFEGATNGFTLNAPRTQATLQVDNAPSTGSQLVYSYSPMFGQ